jgi:predicted GNAT family acetyltransferase
LTSQRELEEETMSSHNPSGKYLCIHSVVVIHGHRRQGIATNLLKMYVKRILEEHVNLALKTERRCLLMR